MSTASVASTRDVVYAATSLKRRNSSSTWSVRRLRLAGDAAGDDCDGSVLAEGARRRQDDAVGDAPADRRERHAPERLEARGAQRPGGLVLVGADLAEDGDHLAHDEGQRHEDRGQHDPGCGEDDLDPVFGEPAAEPAVLAVDQDQGQAYDDRRECERQSDHGVDQPGPVLRRSADERHRAGHAEDGVGRHSDERGDEGQLEGGNERLVGERLEHGLNAVPEGVVDDRREGHRQEDQQVAEGKRPQAVPRRLAVTHRASCYAARGRPRRRGRRRRGAAARRRLRRLPPARRSRSP